MTKNLVDIPEGEANHFHEFYLFVGGHGQMEVQGEIVPIEKVLLLMVEPGEMHRISDNDIDLGPQWVIIKEKSVPHGKYPARNEHIG